MLISATATFYADVIPPRCRKRRFMSFERPFVQEVPEVSRDDAPNAFEVTQRGWSGIDRYRWWNDRVWEKSGEHRWGCEHGQPPVRRRERDRIQRLFGSRNYGDRTPPVEGSTVLVDDYVFISGVLWHQTGEPRYVVQTFGLGGNHGGTSIFVEQSFNSNISNTRYHRADRWDEALQQAIDVAFARGDTVDGTRLRREKKPHIRVLVPEAVRLDPMKDHGEGDPFLNRLEGISAAAGGDTLVSGFGALVALSQELRA